MTVHTLEIESDEGLEERIGEDVFVSLALIGSSCDESENLTFPKLKKGWDEMLEDGHDSVALHLIMLLSSLAATRKLKVFSEIGDSVLIQFGEFIGNLKSVKNT